MFVLMMRHEIRHDYDRRDEAKYGRTTVSIDDIRLMLRIRLATMNKGAFNFGKTADQRDNAIDTLVSKLTAGWDDYHVTQPASGFDVIYAEAERNPK